MDICIINSLRRLNWTPCRHTFAFKKRTYTIIIIMYPLLLFAFQYVICINDNKHTRARDNSIYTTLHMHGLLYMDLYALTNFDNHCLWHSNEKMDDIAYNASQVCLRERFGISFYYCSSSSSRKMAIHPTLSISNFS